MDRADNSRGGIVKSKKYGKTIRHLDGVMWVKYQ